MLTLLPGQLWKIILAHSGYHIKTIFSLITTAKQAVGSQRTNIVEQLARHLEASRRYHRLHWSFDQDLRRRLNHLRSSWNCARVYPNFSHENRYFIPVMFILIKVFYINTIVSMYFVLSYCLGFDYFHFGLPILEKLAFNRTSTLFDERFFPQRTWCQISRMKLGGGTDETWADCVLPINIINNVIFILVWFWLLIVLICTIYGLFKTIWHMHPSNTQYFLGHHLYVHDLYNIGDSAAVLGFIKKFPPDLTVILRLYEIELGHKLVGEIVVQMFLKFKNNNVLESSINDHLP